MSEDAIRSMGPHRRDILAGACVALLGSPVTAGIKHDIDLITGGYARQSNPGVLQLGYQPASKRWLRGTPAAAIRDASFGVYSLRFDLLYMVEERTAGMVTVLRRAGDRRWRQVAQLPSLGADPCHLALDASGLVLAVANYSSGSVGLFRLDRTSGLPFGAGERRTHHGHDADLNGQRSAHAHWVGFAPNARWLLAVDLGVDSVFAHAFDPDTGQIGQTTVAYTTEPGSGPRHLTYHPRLLRAYLVNEFANSVTTLRMVAANRLERLDTISCLPPGFTGKNTAAEIAINRAGTRVYVSNRGHDSIAVFDVGSDGALRLRQHVYCGGAGPRHFLLLEAERRMIVANEGSGSLIPFSVGMDGGLSQQGPGVAVPGVTFIDRV